MSVRIICPLLISLFVILLSDWNNSLNVLDICLLTDICFMNIFSQSLVYFIHVIFDKQTSFFFFFNLMFSMSWVYNLCLAQDFENIPLSLYYILEAR